MSRAFPRLIRINPEGIRIVSLRDLFYPPTEIRQLFRQNLRHVSLKPFRRLPLKGKAEYGNRCAKPPYGRSFPASRCDFSRMGVLPEFPVCFLSGNRMILFRQPEQKLINRPFAQPSPTAIPAFRRLRRSLPRSPSKTAPGMPVMMAPSML